MSGKPQPVLPRLFERRDIRGDCWMYTGSLSPWGYGRIGVSGRMDFVHRVAYELFVGPIPEGFVVDHLCRNRACFNPEHLEPVTNAENISRGAAPSAITFRTNICQRGHSMCDAYIRPDGTGRMCRSCLRLRKSGLPLPEVMGRQL